MILGVIASNFLSRLLPNKQQNINLFEDKLSALVKSQNPFVKAEFFRDGLLASNLMDSQLVKA